VYVTNSAAATVVAPIAPGYHRMPRSAYIDIPLIFYSVKACLFCGIPPSVRTRGMTVTISTYNQRVLKAIFCSMALVGLICLGIAMMALPVLVAGHY
jgi:hypothetical protein